MHSILFKSRYYLEKELKILEIILKIKQNKRKCKFNQDFLHCDLDVFHFIETWAMGRPVASTLHHSGMVDIFSHMTPGMAMHQRKTRDCTSIWYNPVSDMCLCALNFPHWATIKHILFSSLASKKIKVSKHISPKSVSDPPLGVLII